MGRGGKTPCERGEGGRFEAERARRRRGCARLVFQPDLFFTTTAVIARPLALSSLAEQDLDDGFDVEFSQIGVRLSAPHEHHRRAAGLHHAQRGAYLIVDGVKLGEHDAVDEFGLSARDERSLSR